MCTCVDLCHVYRGGLLSIKQVGLLSCVQGLIAAMCAWLD